MWEVLKWICIYMLSNIGFTLAFMATKKGTTYAMAAPSPVRWRRRWDDALRAARGRVGAGRVRAQPASRAL